MAKNVFVVTHGEKNKGPNPGMTSKGFQQVRALRGLISEVPSRVVVGTGRRHVDVAKALLISNHLYISFTPVVGGPESLERFGGKDVVVLADGTHVPLEQYTGTKDGTASLWSLLCGLPDNSVICAGRPAMILLGKDDAKQGVVYRIKIGDDLDFNRIEIEEISVKPTG